MSNRENSEEYQLVLESVDSSDSAMLTRVRGILLGSLELNVEEAKHVLENIPLTIKRSPNEKDLLIHFNSLKEAGARVLLLKPAVKTTSAASHSNNTGDEETLEFEIDLDAEPTSMSEPRAKSYALNLDSHESSMDALNELLTQESTEKKKDPPKSSPADEVDDFKLEVLPAAEGLDLIDPDEKGNDLDESGEWGLNTLSSALEEQKNKAAPAPHKEVPSEKLDVSTVLELEGEGHPVTQSPQPPPSPRKAIDPLPPPAVSPKQSTGDAKASKTLIAPSKPLDLQLENPPEVPAAPQPQQTAATQHTTTPAPQTTPPATMTLESSPAQETVAKKETPAPKPEAQTQTAKVATESPPRPLAATLDSKLEGKAAVTKHAEPRKKKSQMSSSKRNELALIAAICIFSGLVLAGINWFVILNKEEPIASKSTLNVIDSPIESSMPGMQPKPAMPLEKYYYKIDLNGDGKTLKAQFVTDGQNILEFSAEAVNPAPRSLTPEEIVQGFPPLPWLRKIEVSEADFHAKEPGFFTANANAKVYAEQGELRNRYVSAATIELRYEKGAAKPSVSLELRQNLEQLVPDENPYIDLSLPTTPKFFFKTGGEFDPAENPNEKKPETPKEEKPAPANAEAPPANESAPK